MKESEKQLMMIDWDPTYRPIVGDRVAIIFHYEGDWSHWSVGVVLDAGREDISVIDELNQRVYRSQSNDRYQLKLIERLTREQLLTHHVEEVRQLGLRNEV